MTYLGDFAVGSTLNFKFTTRRFTTGSPFTLAGSPAVRVYKNTSDVEDDSGITLTADFDSKTGLNHVTIDLSSDGTFYAAGSDCQVVISAGTVDSVSVVGEVVAQFSIANRPLQSIGANVITATAIASDAITDAKVASDVTIASVTGSVGSVTGAVGSVVGNVGGNVTGSVGSVATGGIAAATFAAGAIDAAALAADAGTEIGTAVWATTTRQLTGTQTFNVTGNITGNLSGSVGSVTGAVGSVIGSVGNVTGSVGSVATGGIVSATFAAGALDAVWATTARLLTAGTNIVLAKGTGVTGFNDLSAAQVNTEADTALADVGVTTTVTGRIDAAITTRASQTSVDTIDDFLDLEVAAIKAKTDNLPAAPAATSDIPTATQNADALLDRAAGVETGLTPRQALRLFAAVTGGKLSGGATTTNTIRNAVADSKNRVVATVDTDGNRTAIVYDLT